MLLVLEDLHWADESSRELLAFLAVRLREQPVMVIATLREEELASEARRWLVELERRPRVTRLRLTGLADAEIAELVSGLMPASGSAAAVGGGDIRRGRQPAVRQGTGKRRHGRSARLDR